ncbi:hypothetical protein [Aidingimonas lacisalsi]|uniref:hypothetical protein n=1 Tax=Aidingimonas lacisalsi TaxID=2604086 RepID=UPI0011D21050|nr:hypothetical protein [Aidingimonas lacisalsi]
MNAPTSLAIAGLTAVILATTGLTGCTVNTYPDGSREAVWGTPQDDDPNRAGTIRDETGETRPQNDAPD